MDIYKVIDEAINFYDIDLKYKEMCYKCIEQIKLEKFNELISNFYEKNFNDIREYWEQKDINKLFWDNVNPFITNVIILYGFIYHIKSIEKFNFDEHQINKQKQRIKECFMNDLVIRKYEGVRISQML